MPSRFPTRPQTPLTRAILRYLRGSDIRVDQATIAALQRYLTNDDQNRLSQLADDIEKATNSEILAAMIRDCKASFEAGAGPPNFANYEHQTHANHAEFETLAAGVEGSGSSKCYY